MCGKNESEEKITSERRDRHVVRSELRMDLIRNITTQYSGGRRVVGADGYGEQVNCRVMMTANKSCANFYLSINCYFVTYGYEHSIHINSTGYSN